MGKRYFRVGRKIVYRIIVILFIFQYYLKIVVKYKICKAGEHLELYNQALFFNDDIQFMRWVGKENYGNKGKMNLEIGNNTFTKRIGQTTYVVRFYYSENAREKMQEIINRMLVNEVNRSDFLETKEKLAE